MHTDTTQAPLDTVETLALRYPDIPVEAIFKEDILRRGMAWSRDALEIAAGYKPRAYFIFSFDLVPIAEMRQGLRFQAGHSLCPVESIFSLPCGERR